MTEHDIHNLVAAYALDALEPDETSAFEAHLASCDSCTTELTEFRETAAALASAETTAPPVRLREQVLTEVHNTRQLPPEVSRSDTPIELSKWRDRRSFAKVALGSVAAAVLIVAGIAVLSDDDPVPDEVAVVYQASDATTITLNQQPPAVAGEVTIVYSEEASAVVVRASDLNPVDDSQTYELWAITASGAEPVGLFVPDDSGGVIEALATDAPADAVWGITVEPEGGSPQPTGDILYLSS
ncbi:MAG: anti-sigma factor [Acidimicrobiales bacterium]